MTNLYDILNLINRNGDVAIDRVLSLLDCNESELANSLGFNFNEINNADLNLLLKTPMTYQHLLMMVCVVNFLNEMEVSRRDAFEWYLSEPIPALGGLTAQTVIFNNNFEYIMDYLQMFKLGGYA